VLLAAQGVDAASKLFSQSQNPALFLGGTRRVFSSRFAVGTANHQSYVTNIMAQICQNDKPNGGRIFPAKTPCRCGCAEVLVTRLVGHAHAGRAECAECGKWIKWVSKAKAARLFGGVA
jgi:hypothetical protein